MNRDKLIESKIWKFIDIYKHKRESIIERRNYNKEDTVLYWTLNGQIDIMDDMLKDLEYFMSTLSK